LKSGANGKKSYDAIDLKKLLMAKVIITDHKGVLAAEIESVSDESIGAQAQDAGAPIPFSCGVGACRTCVCTVKKGKEFLDTQAIGPQHIDVEEDEILSCICGVKEDAPEDAVIELQAENL